MVCAMSDDRALYPLLGFTASIVDGAVVLRLEFARSRAAYSAGVGETQQFVMMPDAATSIGEAFSERGALLAGPAH